MRGCLSFIALVVVLVGALVWFAGPAVAGGLASAGLAAAGFRGTDTTVDVEANPPFELLGLRADSVRIRSSQASLGEVEAGRVDVTLEDVDLGSRTFGSLDGTLAGVTIAADGPDLRVATVLLSGPHDDAAARLMIDRTEVEALVTAAIETASGRGPTAIALSAPDRLRFAVAGMTIGARLEVDERGGIVLRPDSGPLPTVDVFRPPSGVPLKLQAVVVTPAGLELRGRLDAGALGLGG
jgi:hypothetical protein